MTPQEKKKVLKVIEEEIKTAGFLKLGNFGNVLETVTIPDHPEIAAIKKIMMENGADGALMSGSGPTVFGIYKDKEAAERTCEILKKAEGGRLTRQVYLTRFFHKKPAR